VIDPSILQRQRAVLGGEPKPRRASGDSRRGPRRTDAVCPRCCGRRLSVTNRTGICCACWDGMTRKERSAATLGMAPRNTKAKQSTIDLARARLAARGIHVEAA
jgi:hypothetical protein